MYLDPGWDRPTWAPGSDPLFPGNKRFAGCVHCSGERCCSPPQSATFAHITSRLACHRPHNPSSRGGDVTPLWGAGVNPVCPTWRSSRFLWKIRKKGEWMEVFQLQEFRNIFLDCFAKVSAGGFQTNTGHRWDFCCESRVTDFTHTHTHTMPNLQDTENTL